MKINQLLQKLEPAKAQKLKNTLDGLPHSNKTKGTKNQKLTKSRLVTLLENTSAKNQKIILNTFLDTKLPLTENNLIKLINLLENNSFNLNQKSLSNAFSFLAKKGLPILPKFIQGVGQNIETEFSISSQINQSNISENIQELLAITIPQNSNELAEKLAKYPDILKNLLNQLNPKNEQSTQLRNQLLGEYLINTQKEGPLLALEIPLFWSDYKKPVPFYLQIWQEEQSSENNTFSDKTAYNIKLEIDLEKIGLIRTKIIIKDKKINTIFQANSEKTAHLLKENLTLLEKRLAEENYNITTQVIHTNIDKLNSIPNFSADSDTTTQKNEYIHVDFFA